MEIEKEKEKKAMTDKLRSDKNWKEEREGKRKERERGKREGKKEEINGRTSE